MMPPFSGRQNIEAPELETLEVDSDATEVVAQIEDSEQVQDTISNTNEINTIDETAYTQEDFEELQLSPPIAREDDNGEENTCPICFDTIIRSQDSKTLQCGHTFHSSCIDEWTNIRQVCPVCRERVHIVRSSRQKITTTMNFVSEETKYTIFRSMLAEVFLIATFIIQTVNESQISSIPFFCYMIASAYLLSFKANIFYAAAAPRATISVFRHFVIAYDVAPMIRISFTTVFFLIYDYNSTLTLNNLPFYGVVPIVILMQIVCDLQFSSSMRLGRSSLHTQQLTDPPV